MRDFNLIVLVGLTLSVPQKPLRKYIHEKVLQYVNPKIKGHFTWAKKVTLATNVPFFQKRERVSFF